MSRFVAFFRSLRRDESGVSAVEYAVLLALIVGLCLSAISLVGGQTNGAFQQAGQGMPAPAQSPPRLPMLP
jgi:pilus assembly protein Flp/PilA